MQERQEVDFLREYPVPVQQGGKFHCMSRTSDLGPYILMSTALRPVSGSRKVSEITIS